MDDRTPSDLHPREFVTLVAALMAVSAPGVDLMLPALAKTGRDLAVTSANHRQWIVISYMSGFGLRQLLYGALADRFGRSPVLLLTVAGVVGASVFAAASATFAALLGGACCRA